MRAASIIALVLAGRPMLHLYRHTGTTLAWLGDPAAEDYARHAAAHYETGDQPRRLAMAYLNLGLVLARLGRPDEAEVPSR